MNAAKEAVANDTFASPEHQVQYNKGDMYCYKVKSSKEAVDVKIKSDLYVEVIKPSKLQKKMR